MSGDDVPVIGKTTMNREKKKDKREKDDLNWEGGGGNISNITLTNSRL